MEAGEGIRIILTSYYRVLENAWTNCSPTYLTYLLFGILLTLLTTRIISGLKTSRPPISSNGISTVPQVPYWIPILGHLPNMALDADGFVKSLRSKYTQGAFALNFGGTTHNVFFTPGLATALLNEKLDKADSEDVVDGLLQTIFGFPSKDMSKYKESRPEIMACYKYLLTEPPLSDMVQQTVKKTKENVQSLVTFSSSPVDEMPWERSGDAKVTTNSNGEQVVEASLLQLTRDFCGHTANPTIMGSDFLANFPDFFDNLWKLDRGFLFLSTGLPRWLPIPILTRAHIARKRIIEDISTFHSALDKHVSGEDPGVRWRNLDDVGALVRARVDVYRKYGWSIRARAAIEHSLNWAANANSNALVFWMLNRIYADFALLTKLREEIQPYIKATQPEQTLPIPEPPRMEIFAIDGLCDHCPLLKSCYIESLRVDTASWSFKVVKQDFAIQSRDKDANQSWLLRKGEYAHAAHDLHNTDSSYFEDPMNWKADRHIKHDADGKAVGADMGSIRPYGKSLRGSHICGPFELTQGAGGGSSMCKGRSFAFKECIGFVAAIVALWDIEPAAGGPWKMPRHRKATGVYGTSDDTRVWIRRRKLPERSL